MSVQGTPVKDAVYGRVLELAHQHLGLDVAWISEFRGGEQTIRAVAGDGGSFGEVAEGSTLDHSTTYCSRVVSGALPSAVPDVRSDPLTRDMPVTAELDVGAYVGVPVTLPGGEVHGMLCSLSHSAAAVDERDVQFLRLLADVLAQEVHESDEVTRDREQRAERIRTVLGGEGLRMVFQPIVRLNTMRVAGAEALARFDAEPRNPALWFSEAAMLDMGVDLDLAAMRSALSRIDELPEGAYLSLNASPDTVVAPELRTLLAAAPAGRILLEITEQTAIADYEPIVAALREMRALGVRVAVDDAGAGYASLNHILRLRPDVIKLDVALTRDIDSDPARQALARALVDFGRSIGADLVAEGVETQTELDMLVWLGVTYAQGYFLARPGDLPLPDAVPLPTPRLTRSETLASVEAADDEAFARAVLAEAAEVTGLESAYLTFRDEGRLEHRWVHNASDLEVPEPFTIEYEDSLCHRCRQAGLMWTADVPGDLPGVGLAEAAGIQTFVSVPTGDGGTLCALSRDRRFLDRTAIERLEQLASKVGERLKSP